MDYSRSLSEKAAHRLEARIYVLEILISELSCIRKFTAGHMFSCSKHTVLVVQCVPTGQLLLQIDRSSVLFGSHRAIDSVVDGRS